ncbi:MAG: transposase, partial [Thermodesulforhabdaceae bacterium]
VALDEWVVMPNHFHGIIVITANPGRGGSRTAPTEKRKPVGRLIGAFKTVSTKHINTLRGTPGTSLWQRNYYEHIIRNAVYEAVVGLVQARLEKARSV